jgi:hypothetical protein
MGKKLNLTEEEKKERKREKKKEWYQKDKIKKSLAPKLENTPEQEEKIRIKKLKKKEYDKKYNSLNKEKKNKQSKKYWEDHTEEMKEWNKKYREENKEILKEKQKEYGIKHKEQKKEYDKNHRPEYYIKNIDKFKEYAEANKNKISKSQKERRVYIKREALNVLGGCRCFACEDETLCHLTVDHIDNTGYLDKKNGLKASTLYSAIAKGEYPQDKILNLRVSCWNHNLSRRREYLNLPSESQTVGQRCNTKLWKEAFEFFGPCHCGISDLKFLSISHINNDGAERRKNGEPSAASLLSKFRQAGWPESLKEEFCLECFNHNCKKI